MKLLILITILAAICLSVEVALEAEAAVLPAFLRNKQLAAAAKNEAYYRKPTSRRRRSRSSRSRSRSRSSDEDEDDEADAKREEERRRALAREQEERERVERERREYTYRT